MNLFVTLSCLPAVEGSQNLQLSPVLDFETFASHVQLMTD